MSEMNDTDFWYNIDSGKHYLLTEGKTIATDNVGRVENHFVHYFTGYSNYKDRMKYFYITKKRCVIPRYRNQKHLHRSLKMPSSLEYTDRCSKISAESTLTHPSTLFSKDISFANKHHNKKRAQIKSMLSSSSRIKDSDGLRSKEKMRGYSINIEHLSDIKETFKPMNNINSLKSKIVELLMRKEENTVIHENRDMARSYYDITNKLKKEYSEIYGFKEIPEKESRIISKGIFAIHIPTEIDLYMNAKKRRSLLNFTAFEKEKQIEKTDLMLLKKRRNQRILKNKAMQTIIHNKQKRLLKEIVAKNKYLQIK